MKVALICIAKNEDHYLHEWIEYNIKLGFDHIYIYENNWICPLEHKSLTKIKWDGVAQQLPTYNHFIKTYGNQYDWGAFIDCDEFIVLKKHNNIKELIEEYNNTVGLNINWKFFGNMNKMERDDSGSLIKQFTKSQIGTNRHIKTIINLRASHRFVNPHFTNIPTKNVNGSIIRGPFNYNGSDDVAYIAHYYQKTYQDWQERVVRGKADCIGTRKLEEWKKNINEVEDFNEVDNFDLLNFMYNTNE
jgi:hypothetical protein